MSADVEPGDLFRREPLRLLSPLPWAQLSRLVRAGLLVAGLAVLGIVGYLGATHYPDTSPPQGSDLERQIASVYSLPAATADAAVVRDYLVERFYAIDVDSGDRYVADVLKGRIQAIQASAHEEGASSYSYTLLLDLRNLQRDRALYAAYVYEVARPQGEGLGEYLGLRALPGVDDAFPLNYDGTLPERRQPFRGPDGEDLYDFLLSRRLADVAGAPQLIGQDGFNYLLSSTERFPFFREFGTGRAIFLSELVIVDATGRPQERAFFKLLEQYPRSVAR